MNKRASIIALLIVIGAAAVWYARSGGATPEGTLFASGTVEATDADLGFLLPGRVASISAREGDRVEAATELARLDTKELDASVQAAQAQLAAAEARERDLSSGARPQEVAAAEAVLTAATERVTAATRDAERARTLFEGGAVSRQTAENAATALEVATADREQARERLDLVREGTRTETLQAQRSVVAQARAQLALVEASRSNAVITAPFSGVVTIRHREPGETVTPGAPVVTLLDPDDRWVRIYVREDAIGRVSLGLAAEIRSDTYPDRTYSGEVVFIGNEAEFTPRNVQTTEERTKLVYPVKVRITGDVNFELKPGVPADVTLIEN